jgi:AraC family transcriptional regulator, transcriptional activator FtrA
MRPRPRPHPARDGPAVRLNPAVLYVDDGQILTSAGNAASADLALHILRSDYGAEIANTVARHLVVPPHRRGGQAQYVETPVAVRPEAGDRLAATLEWAMQRPGQPLPVKALAAHCGLSLRQFTRQFRQAPAPARTSGCSPSGSPWPSGSWRPRASPSTT